MDPDTEMGPLSNFKQLELSVIITVFQLLKMNSFDQFYLS